MSISFPASQDGSLKDVGTTLPSNTPACGWPAASPLSLAYGSRMKNSESSSQAVSAKLRAIRITQGYSLNDVELKSHGAIKAVVLGSYERGSRSMSVSRAIEIANFYGVPPFSLFLEKYEDLPSHTERIILDLRAVRRSLLQGSQSQNLHIHLLARYTTSLLHARQDWNGEIISIRNTDLDNVGLLVDMDRSTLLTWLDEQRFLLKKPVKN